LSGLTLKGKTQFPGKAVFSSLFLNKGFVYYWNIFYKWFSC